MSKMTGVKHIIWVSSLRVSYTGCSGYKHQLISVDKKNQLDVTFCILYFSYNSLECTHCGIPCLQNTVLVHSESAHTVGSLTVHSAHSPGTFKECTHCGIHIVYSSHSSGTYRECTHCGIPCCLQNIVLVHTESAHTVGSHVVYKTQSCYIQRVHTLWDPMLFTKHSPGTFKECTHCGIPCCLQNTVLVHTESAHTVGSHTVHKTQYWYIQRVHTVCALSECTSTVFSYLAWWWFLWTETYRQIFNIARNI